MQPFDYHEPATLAAAIDMVRQYEGEAVLMAGGTSLALLMGFGLARPEHVIGLRRIKELHGIRTSPDGGLQIGAMVTHAEVERSQAIAAYCPAMRVAFSDIATIRIRNQATLGGNLAHADPAQDPPPMLLALDATVIAVGPDGERQIALTDLFLGFFETSLSPEEIITTIVLPPPAERTAAAYLKFLPRTHDDYATVSVAVWLQAHADSRCAQARIAIGAAGPVPLRARQAEELLRGGWLDDEAIDLAAASVWDAVDPIDDGRGSAAYKRDMARVWTGRALRQAAEGLAHG